MDLTLTTLVHQKGSRPLEAVLGFIDRMDEAERELECKRGDGTTFDSVLRSLHIKDEESVVRLTLWGKKAAVQEPRRERLRVGDLLVVTNVQIDRFMGDRAFKVSGFRPSLRVVRGLASARAVLDRLGLEKPGPYLARVEELWRWKELEDMRDQRMRRQAQQRDAALTVAAAAATAGGGDGGPDPAALALTQGAAYSFSFDGLSLNGDDAHVRGAALPLMWVEVAPKEGGGGTGRGGAGATRLPPPNPRFLRTKVTDEKGVSHVLDLPQGIEGLLAFEHASKAAAAAAAASATSQRGGARRGGAANSGSGGNYLPLPVLLHSLGARAVGGLLVPCPTPRTRVTLLPSSSSPTAREAAAAPSSSSSKRGVGGGGKPLSVSEALGRVRRQAQARPARGERAVLQIVGRVVEVAVGAGRAPLVPEDGGGGAQIVQQLVVARPHHPRYASSSSSSLSAAEKEWRYQDIHLRVVDAAAAGAAAGARGGKKGEEDDDDGCLWVRIPDAALRPLLAHVPAGRLVEEEQEEEEERAAATTAATASASAATAVAAAAAFPSPFFFYTRWVHRALAALASPRNPPFRLTVRLGPPACGSGSGGPVPAVARGLGLLASQVPCAEMQPALRQPDVELVRLAEAPPEEEEEEGMEAMEEDG